MSERPSIFPATTYYDPNKEVLKDWLWKIFRVTLLKDHRTLVDISGRWAGFLVKSGALYYATLVHPKGQ